MGEATKTVSTEWCQAGRLEVKVKQSLNTIEVM